jgi:hypothetical protein
MKKNERVFVSFTGKLNERIFAINVLERLNEHQKELAWQFFRAEEHLALGSNIITCCKVEIDKATIFIALLSATYFNNNFTIVEIQHAMSRKLQIIPAFLPGFNSHLVPPEFSELLSTFRFQVDNLESDSVEKIIIFITKKLNLKYQPDDKVHNPQLPIYKRMIAEINDANANNSEKGNIENEAESISISADITKYYTNGNLYLANRKCQRLIDFIEEKYPHHHFYYPYLVEIITFFELKRQSLMTKDQLYKLIQQLNELQRNSKFDANLFALKGYFLQELNDFKGAFDQYVEADKISECFDPDIAYNLLISGSNCNVNKNELNKILTFTKLFQKGFATPYRIDSSKFFSLRLLYNVAIDNINGFKETFSKLPDHWIPDTNICLKIVEFIYAKTFINLFDSALEIIRLCIEKASPDRNSKLILLRRKAYILLTCNRYDEGISELLKIDNEFPNHPMSYIEAYIFSKKFKNKRLPSDKLQKLIEKNHEEIDPKISEDDYNYYSGLVQYLYNHEITQNNIFFKRSRYDVQFFYNKVIDKI